MSCNAGAESLREGQRGELCGGGRPCRRGRCRGLEEGDALEDIEAAAAEKLVDDGLRETGGIVLDADGAVGLGEVNAADAVDLTQAGEAEGGGFRGGGTIAIENIDCRHRA